MSTAPVGYSLGMSALGFSLELFEMSTFCMPKMIVQLYETTWTDYVGDI